MKLKKWQKLYRELFHARMYVLVHVRIHGEYLGGYSRSSKFQTTVTVTDVRSQVISRYFVCAKFIKLEN